MARYDVAAWHATDALLALNPEPSEVNVMLAQDSAGRWIVKFGHLTPSRDTFFLNFIAREQARPDSFIAHSFTPPLRVQGHDLLAARALRLAYDQFGPMQTRYNAYVLDRPDSTFWVYLLPATTEAGQFLHGADVRYLVCRDGRAVIDSQRMHRALLNLALTDSSELGWHTVLLDDVPQDSDVFLVLARRPRRPELIQTAHYLYQVHVDGSITWQPNDATRER